MFFSASTDASRMTLVGHGVTALKEEIEIIPGLSIKSPLYNVKGEKLEEHTGGLMEYAAILTMGSQATFAIEVHSLAHNDLVAQSWNSLWMFLMMTVACKVPCYPLFAYSDEPKPRYSLINRNVLIAPHEDVQSIQSEEVAWLRSHYDIYKSLIKDNDRFRAALRSLNNASYLFDFDQRLMLLWVGIEGLLGIDGELRRRLALHVAMLLDGTHAEKIERFERCKKAYDFRSRVVHGAILDSARLKQEYKYAFLMLAALLAKCIELGRVPTAKELDETAIKAVIS